MAHQPTTRIGLEGQTETTENMIQRHSTGMP